MKHIDFWDYRAEYEAERDEILAAVDTVFRSGRLILGAHVARLETEFARYCGLDFGVGVNSGTDAIFLALKALGVGPGDEVVTVSNTAVPTVSAIRATGAAPRFVDIDPSTYLMDVSKLDAAITTATKCILPVHLFGQSVRMEEVRRVASAHGLQVLEDCAQSQGGTRNGIMTGAMSDLAAFSFYPTKVLGAYGDAGMVCTNDEELVRRLRRLRMYGMEGARSYSEDYELLSSYYAYEDGYNSRLDEVQAAILLAKLPRIAHYVQARQQIASFYDEQLADTDVTLPHVDAGNSHAYYLYVCRHPRRDAIIAGMAARGVSLKVDYPWPVHLMPAYSNLGYGPGSLPQTELAAREIFSLPIYPSLDSAVQQAICDALHDVISELSSSPGSN